MVRYYAKESEVSKLIILNGGKGCGKSDLVRFLMGHQSLSGLAFKEARCKDRLFDMVMDIFRVEPEVFWNIYNNRVLKEAPSEHFVITAGAYAELCRLLPDEEIPYERIAGSNKVKISIRHAMIYVSELVAKPMFGEEYFGEARADAMTCNSGILYIDDSAVGKMEEITPAIQKLGEDNVLVMRIYGRGDFGGDSRRFLPDNSLKNQVDVYNDGTLPEYLHKAYELLEDFIHGRK